MSRFDPQQEGDHVVVGRGLSDFLCTSKQALMVQRLKQGTAVSKYAQAALVPLAARGEK